MARDLKTRYESARMSMLRYLNRKRQPEQERRTRDNTIITLCNSGLLSRREIAEIMGVPIHTVYYVMKKAALNKTS